MPRNQFCAPQERARKAKENIARERAEASAAAAAAAAASASPSKKISDNEQYVLIEEWPTTMVTLQPCCCELILCI